MSLPILIALVVTNCFGAVAVLFSFREEKAKKLLAAYEEDEKRRHFQTNILKDIHDRLGYSFAIEKIVAVITDNLDGLLTYSTYSTIILKNDKLLFKTHLKEKVGHECIASVKDSMLASLAALEHDPLPPLVDEGNSGINPDDSHPTSPASFFHLPLFSEGKTIALITIASTKPNHFAEKDMHTLYRVTDLTSKAITRLQNTLKVEKGKLMAMIGSLTDGLLMIDMQSQLTVINPAALTFLKISKQEPGIIDVLSALPAMYNFHGKIQTAINEKKSFEEKDVRIGDKLFHVLIHPVLDVSDVKKEQAIGASVMLHDVTLAKSLAQMKEDFTNIIIHELRSPLTAIKASTQLLIAPKALTEEEKMKLTHLIHEQSNKMLDEVSFILDAAKLEAGLFTVQKEQADLKQLIQERVGIFIPQAHEKMINLVTDVDDTIPVFSFDSHHISQVLNNLISNSLKFTPTGGTIRVTAKQILGKAQLSVSDTGSGIPKEKQHLLFSKFSQISTPNAQTGTGLGLFLVKGIIEAHGGSISLQSDEGKGTTISFTLPLETTEKIGVPVVTPAVSIHQNMVN